MKNNMTKRELLLIRHTQAITDPFPKHSEYNWKRDAMYLIHKFFWVTTRLEKPEEISIWAAYRMGYEKAFADIEAKLPDSHIKSTENQGD